MCKYSRMPGMEEAEMSTFFRSLPAWMRSSGDQAPRPSQEIHSGLCTVLPQERCPRRTEHSAPLEGVTLRSANPLPLAKPVRLRKDKTSVARK